MFSLAIEISAPAEEPSEIITLYTMVPTETEDIFLAFKVNLKGTISTAVHSTTYERYFSITFRHLRGSFPMPSAQNWHPSM